MAVTESTHAPSPEDAGSVGIKLVDCDVHPAFQKAWQLDLAPYLPAGWARKVAGETFNTPQSVSQSGAGFLLPVNGFYPLPRTAVRQELVRPNEPPPCSDPVTTGHDLFDKFGIDRAILVPLVNHQHFPTPKVAEVLSVAHNSYIEERWLATDSRWRGLISAPWSSPAKAVEEIERRASESNQWVGILILSGDRVMGHDMFWPIYEVCEHYGLPVQVHVTGAYAMFHTGGSFAGGLPLHHMDYRISFLHADQNNLASMVSAGVFERFPKLKLVIAESGFAWAPQVIWHMDTFWKGNREDTPWLQRPPSEYVFEHVRWTTQPLIEPPKVEHLRAMLDMISAERTLMFSTDYPHWDADEPDRVFRALPESLRERVAYKNALETYGDRLL